VTDPSGRLRATATYSNWNFNKRRSIAVVSGGCWRTDTAMSGLISIVFSHPTSPVSLFDMLSTFFAAFVHRSGRISLYQRESLKHGDRCCMGIQTG
jgi:hypothetical protein